MSEFKSQVGTSKEQSQRLIDLGVNTDTADLSRGYHDILYTFPYKETKHFLVKNKGTDRIDNFNVMPSWSVDRLIEMLNYQVVYEGYKYEPIIDVSGAAYVNVNTKDAVVGWTNDNRYDDLIDCIEWLIKQGVFRYVK